MYQGRETNGGPAMWTIYVGTYLSPHSRGVYRFTLEGRTGHLAGGELALPAADSKYLAGRGAELAMAYGIGGSAGVMVAQRRGGHLMLLDGCAQGAIAPCHVAFHGPYVATANYHDGMVHLYHWSNGVLGRGPTLSLGQGAGCHQTLTCGPLLLVPCLEQDRIRVFHLERDCGEVGEISFPPGCGPRHAVTSPDGTRLFVLGERDNRLYGFRARPPGRFHLEEMCVFLPRDAPEGSLSAALRLSPEGCFLTASTRGANLLTTWRVSKGALELVQQTPSGGDHPRDFLVTPDGQFLLCAHRGEGGVVCLRRDPAQGLVGEITGRMELAQAVSLACLEGE